MPSFHYFEQPPHSRALARAALSRVDTVEGNERHPSPARRRADLPSYAAGTVEAFTSWRTWPEAEAALRGRLREATLEQLRDAATFAQTCHADQRRPTGEPYVVHLFQTLEVLVIGAGITEPEVLTAALLHDVVEDTPCTIGQVAERFGPRVANLVEWVTKPRPDPGETSADARRRYLVHLREAPPDALLVKLADRVSNVQTLDKLPGESRRRAYYQETVDFVLPLAEPFPWFKTWLGAWQSEFQHLR
jgi:(p)ppGpp synthase/HD superfamily hydrolase